MISGEGLSCAITAGITAGCLCWYISWSRYKRGYANGVRDCEREFREGVRV